MIQLTEEQKKIINSPARVKLVMGGMRSGKTTLAIMNMWEEMKRQNNPNFKSYFLVKSDPYARNAYREIKRLLGIIPDSMFDFSYKTQYGTINILTNLAETNYDNITIDNASSNKYIPDVLNNHKAKISLFGHCPDNKENAFFKVCYDAIKKTLDDTELFRIESWDNPQMNVKRDLWEAELKEKMGDARYSRDYLAKFID